MARCQCAGSSCSCQFQGAGGTTITGSGTVTSPYIVDSSPFSETVYSFQFPEGFYAIGSAGNLGSRAAVMLYLNQDNFDVQLPSDVPDGTQIDIFVQHQRPPEEPQYTLNVHGGIDYWADGPTLPASSAAKLTWYTCVKVDNVNWFIKVALTEISA